MKSIVKQEYVKSDTVSSNLQNSFINLVSTQQCLKLYKEQ